MNQSQLARLSLALCTVLAACGDDATETATDSDAAISTDAETTAPGSPPGGGSTLGERSVASDPTAATAADDDAGADGDAAIADAGPATSVEVPVATLPSDGELASVCSRDDDCNGDDLVCVVYGTYRGYCSEDCASDDDCSALDGIDASCSGGRCVIDCTGSGAGDGPCPSQMECAETASAPLSTRYRCQYPEPKDHAVYEPCDALRGNADCMEGLSCSVFVGLPLLSELALPYCSEGCSDAADCSDPGSGATVVCDRANPLASEGQCALACENDKQCPGDTLCVSVNVLQPRCGYRP
ncbi:MAG: hypothetical protein OEZ06_17205 [Myxococcales bacterium]|nr:hypothetical protein [Myxococcales bacterium]